MYFEGGIYADVDVENVLPIKKWPDNMIEECEVIIGMENDLHVSNWGFASRRNHPLFEKAYKLSISRFINGIDTTNEHFVHMTTGPGVITETARHLTEDLNCFKLDSGVKETQEMYDSCREALKSEYGLCLVERETLVQFFKNHYASQKKELQSEEWISSWTEKRDIIVRNSLSSIITN